MKKLIALIVTVALVFTISVPVAFAAHFTVPQTSSTQLSGLQSYSLSDLYKMFKQYHKDKSKRTAILKQILEKKKSAAKSHSNNMMLVFVNGDEMITDVPPVVKYNRTLIPVRALMTALGAQVTWDQTTKTVTVTKGDIKIVLKLDSNIVLVNGKEVKIDAPASSYNGRTVIPLRFIAEQFGQNVEWDSSTGSIIIEDKDLNNTTPASAIINDNTTGTGLGQFNYQGSWSYGQQQGAYNTDDHWSNQTDAYYQVLFQGTQIKVYAALDPSHGVAGISVDGSAESLVDLYSATRTDNVVIYTSPVLTSGQHVLKVRVTGTKSSVSTGTNVSVDRAEVISSTVAPVITNIALNKASAASSAYDTTMTSDKAFDGKTDTRWSSQYTDDQWIAVDLGQVQSIGKVKLSWETAYAKAYKVLVSDDNTNWSEVYNTTAGDGGIDEITFNPVNARYVKVQGTQRATNYGYSLLEFEVYSK